MAANILPRIDKAAERAVRASNVVPNPSTTPVVHNFLHGMAPSVAPGLRSGC